ncbi:MAG TPA: cytochrome c biogenesis heme-transporting ATPase CcmA [Crenotrichaceae bacterium]|nr:cytochrome c biogenesis heme-transporting ATPase CcmA [Crenotrichaceae bacterium]
MSDIVSLETRNLECIRDDRVLFSQLNFSVKPHQALILEGDNGCGKTSLLRILCGIRLPDQGQVMWNGLSIQESISEYYQDMVYVGHLDGVKGDLSVAENLRMCTALGSRSGMSIEDALNKVSLSGYEDVRAQVLSAGQRRRVALASLLLKRCSLWILDEPFTALDRTSRGVFENIMSRHLNQGGMIILTSHHSINLTDSSVYVINLSA